MVNWVVKGLELGIFRWAKNKVKCRCKAAVL